MSFLCLILEFVVLQEKKCVTSQQKTLFAFSLALKSFFCFGVSSESFSKNGLDSFNFETNNVFDPPSRLSFKHKDFLDFMDKELEKLSLKTAFEKEDENYGYRRYTHTPLRKVYEQENVENKTDTQNTTKESESRTSINLENFIDKSITNGSEAESNNHVSHLNPAPEYNIPSSDVIVKELGNSALNSAGYQDKVVYVPIYDTPNTQPGTSYANQNFAQNDINSGTHINQNRKMIGFIGVVFVHKLSEDGIGHTHQQNNFQEQNQGVLQNLQNTQPTYSDAPGDFQNKFSNAVSFNNFLPQQVVNNGLSEEAYRVRQQKTSGNYPANSVPINPNNEQWKVQKPLGIPNGLEANSGVKYAPDLSQAQEQTFSQQSGPWITQNQNLGSSQNTFQIKGNIPQGNSKVNKNGRQNFDSRRQIPENPLFPARGNAKPKNSPVSKFSVPNKQLNNLSNKNNMPSNTPGLHHKQQSNNYPNLNQQQNINLNDGIYSNDLTNMIAISDGKGSGQFIPVIKHVVIEKHVQSTSNPHLLPNSGDILNDNGAQGGMYQNIQNFEQIEQHLINPTSQNLGVNYVTNVKKSGSIPSIESSSQSQWAPRPNNQINRPAQIQYLDAPNNLVQLEQYRGNNEKSLNDQIYKNIQTKNPHHENPNRQKFNQGSVASNSNTQHPFFENLSNSNLNQNANEQSRQMQSYNSGTSLNQEFSVDPEIREAFRVAGIYIQNQAHTVPSQNENNAARHNPFETTDSSQVYSQEVKNNQNSLRDSNNIRPTTDQRYNALYHERNNNLNIIRLRDKLLQSHQRTDPVQHFNNEMQKYGSFNGTNIFQQNLGNSVATPHEIKMKIQGETPNQNGWQVIQNIKNTQSSVTYQNDANSNVYDRSKMNPTPESHIFSNQRSNPNNINDQHPSDTGANSFQMKDAVTHPQQRTSITQTFNSNHNHPGQQLYSRISQNNPKQQLHNNAVQIHSGHQLHNSAPQKKDDTLKENEGVLVFTGYGKQDWNGKGRYNHNTNQAHPQQHGQFRQGNHFKEDDSMKVGQRPPVSVISTSNGRSDHHDKTTKAWYKRDLENINNNSLKRDDGKVDNSNDYIIKDADGADPNGFGGESFW
ncbi:hypothetical protein AVEN_252307-1 [Araneus ventricosus]|uniref:Uncharacterized protein n=1 Tax=Araneus ventricosus TaxID=182803 RepID=A0A4Y2DS32_ARAVE|nr:hypothetical protein AVEN_252307-1 [Araneus ventricosus]